MVAQGGGKIINIGSMTSIFGASFAAPYSATKGGIVQFTKAMAVAWAKDNIQANAILPGWIDTALTVQARKDVEGLHERVVGRTPAGRWGVPGRLRRHGGVFGQHGLGFRHRRRDSGRRRLFVAGLAQRRYTLKALTAGLCSRAGMGCTRAMDCASSTSVVIRNRTAHYGWPAIHAVSASATSARTSASLRPLFAGT